MQLSTKTRYAVRLLIRMAREDSGRVWRKQDLSRLEAIPVDYVAQILLVLKRAGMVGSQRGTKGGFVLAADPAVLTVADVVEATDGVIALVPCTKQPEVCRRSDFCVVQEVWVGAGKVLRDYLRGITILSLAKDVTTRSKGTMTFEI